LIDNQPKTSPDKQVVSNIFGECQRYPSISANAESTREHAVTPEKRKDDFERPIAKKPKREAKTPLSAVKIAANKQTRPKPPQKPKKQTCKRTKQQTKTQRKPSKNPAKKPKTQSKAKPKKQPKTPKYIEAQAVSDPELNFEYVDRSSEDEPEWLSSVFSDPVLMPRH